MVLKGGSRHRLAGIEDRKWKEMYKTEKRGMGGREGCLFWVKVRKAHAPARVHTHTHAHTRSLTQRLKIGV